MKITRQLLEQAAQQKVIQADQVDPLVDFLCQHKLAPRFNVTHLLYYFGGLLAIGAMTLFMNLGWESFGGWGIVALSVLYAVFGLGLTEYFRQRSLVIPAGICATFVIALTPLAVYGLQLGFGWWPDDTRYQDYHRYIEWHWLYMELATLVVGVVLAWRYKYPFMLMPIALTLWYLSMDLAAMLVGTWPDFALRSLVSLYFGLAMLALAFWVDIRSRHTLDYAFWLYLFGVITFWGGLTAQESNNEWSKLGYFVINLLMMGVGIVLVRRVFVIFAAFGCCGYIGHLAFSVFEDSWLFPIALTLIGLGVIYLGVLWQKHEQRLSQRLRSFLPRTMQELLANKL